MSQAASESQLLAMHFAIQRDAFALKIDASVSMHGVTGIFGASGAGKTTLLRCIAGLEKAAEGRLTVGGEVWIDTENGTYLAANERDVAYVFQEARLFPHLNVRCNLDYGRKRARRPHSIPFDQVVELLGLSRLMDRKPQTLSGGETQRVAIGRAILRTPSVLLMDEPLASLDVAHRKEVLPFIERLNLELNIPVVYVSHNIGEVCLLCDQLIVLDHGRMVAQGSLQAVLARTDLPLLAGEEAGTVIRGKAISTDAEFGLSRVSVSGGELLVPGQYAVNSASLRLRIRANDVSLCREKPARSSILNYLGARIEEIQDETVFSALVHLRSGSDFLLARVTRRSVADLELQPGDEVIAQIKSVSVRTPKFDL